MNPAVEAAIIGGGAAILSGGWTALVAITTSRVARRTNQATIDAAAANTARMLDAARQDRIWDMRAEAYVNVMRFVQHQQALRRDRTRTVRYDQATEQQIQETLAGIKLPDWPDVEMRLLAYASDQVLNSARATGVANDKVEKAYLHWKWLSDETRKGGPGAPSGAEVIAAQNAIEPALKDAERVDEALLDAIRADLHQRPSQTVALPSGDTV